MVSRVHVAEVWLWGEQAGAVAWDVERELAVFEFAPAFLRGPLDLAPITMPRDEARRRGEPYLFPALGRDTFMGLPGLLADSLPDKFGNSIIDAWLARQGRDPGSFSPVERLCYVGTRGMGALEFRPAHDHALKTRVPVEVAELVALAQEVMRERSALDTGIGADGQGNADAILDILRVGTSAGGARPKAIVAINDAGRVISGQTKAPPGYDYWLLKFDGVTDLELGDTRGYGRIEYAYYRMAQAAGVVMSECRLLEEGGRAHFLTRRFDRRPGHAHEKLHMQSLCGIGHYDYNQPGMTSYENAFMVMRKLRLPRADAEQQYRRMLFNVAARNQDDHTKNIAFIMDEQGTWRLAPAFDVTYSHNPKGRWTNQHQMTINGKRDHFTREDLLTVGRSIGIGNPAAVLGEVWEALGHWPVFAADAGVNPARIREVAVQHRLRLE